MGSDLGRCSLSGVVTGWELGGNASCPAPTMVGPQEVVVTTRRGNQYQRPTRMYRHRRDVRNEGICGLTSALATLVRVEQGVEQGGNALWPAPMELGRSARPDGTSSCIRRPC